MRLKEIKNVVDKGNTTFFTVVLEPISWWEKLFWKDDREIDCYKKYDSFGNFINIDTGVKKYLSINWDVIATADIVQQYALKHDLHEVTKQFSEDW